MDSWSRPLTSRPNGAECGPGVERVAATMKLVLGSRMCYVTSHAMGRFCRLFLMVSLVGIGIPWASRDARAQGLVLSADLAVQFICPGKERSFLEDKVEQFLKETRFKVLNLARIQHEQHVVLLETDIKGLDENRRLIELRSEPSAADRYVLLLYTQPPTRRAAELESKVLQFVSDTLKCEMQEVTPRTKGTSAIAFYDRLIKRTENLFLEAERLRGGRRL